MNRVFQSVEERFCMNGRLSGASQSIITGRNSRADDQRLQTDAVLSSRSVNVRALQHLDGILKVYVIAFQRCVEMIFGFGDRRWRSVMVCVHFWTAKWLSRQANKDSVEKLTRQFRASARVICAIPGRSLFIARRLASAPISLP